jgi:hypothetical protein
MEAPEAPIEPVPGAPAELELLPKPLAEMTRQDMSKWVSEQPLLTGIAVDLNAVGFSGALFAEVAKNKKDWHKQVERKVNPKKQEEKSGVCFRLRFLFTQSIKSEKELAKVSRKRAATGFKDRCSKKKTSLPLSHCRDMDKRVSEEKQKRGEKGHFTSTSGSIEEINALTKEMYIQFDIRASSLNTGPKGIELVAWLNEETTAADGSVELGNVVLALQAHPGWTSVAPDPKCALDGWRILVEETKAPIRNAQNQVRNTYIPNQFRQTAKRAFDVSALCACCISCSAINQ